MTPGITHIARSFAALARRNNRSQHPLPASLARCAIGVALLCTLAFQHYAQAQPPQKVIQTMPAQNASSAARATAVSAMFGLDLIPATANDTTFIVTGSRSGRHRATVRYNANNYVATLTPSSPFIPGESVQAIVTRGGVTSQLTEEPIATGFGWKFTVGASNGTCAFASDSLSTLDAAGAPSAVATADFNGDGSTDLVSADAGGRTISIFLNTQRQRLAKASTYLVPCRPSALACADVDGDGRIDIVAAGDSSIAVLLNKSAGEFSPAASYAVHASVSALALSDLDNDGAPDCATANPVENTVTFLKNDRRGHFSAVLQTVAVGRAPSGIALEDVNNDGAIDGLVCNSGSNSVTILTNRGLARFTSDSVYAVHAEPSAIVAFDFDNDGWTDFAAVNRATNDLSIYVGNGKGGFLGPGELVLPGLHPSSLCGGDFDGDGDIDLAAACPASNSVVIMQNNGYTFPTVASVPAGAGATCVAVLEMSGTYGILDIASANAGDSTIAILKNKFFLPPPAVLTLSESVLAFPETPADSARTLSVRLSAAFSPLTIDSVVSRTGCFSSSAPMPFTIPSFGSMELPIVFSPRAVGAVADTLSIWSSAGTSLLAVTGTAVDKTLSVLQNGREIPKAYTLEQNYPNPFNPSTTIGFAVPQASKVQITIYDILGRVAARLFEGSVAAGSYSVVWNAENYPSGIYFYTMTTAAYTHTRRLVLIK